MTSPFSDDYQTCREKFRQNAEQYGYDVETFPIDEQGPNGEMLAFDCAIGGDPNGETTLILSSGLHGVEGFFGSAVQIDTMQRFGREGLSGIRCIMMHALNPYGFAWIRRFDHNNIDPNRNFVLPRQPREGCPAGLPELQWLLAPQRPPSKLDPFLLKAAGPILRQGIPALRQIIAAGQYEYPKGLFFGGKQPVESQTILDRNMSRWIGNSQTIGHLDFHTGLGRSGDHRLLIEFRPTKKQRALLTDWYGKDAFETGSKPEIAYQTQGGFGPWCVKHQPDATYLFGCAEFGTYSSISVLSALRTENQAFHWSKTPATVDHWSKQRLKERFYPASPQWRRRVLQGSRQLVDQTVAGLQRLMTAEPATT